MTVEYRVRWVGAREAGAVAALERKLHPAEQRIGRDEIEEDLYEADLDGVNLSLGLYVGERMVGYLLAYHERDRRKIPSYLGLPTPQSIALEGAGLFIADYAVLKRHRRGAGLLVARLGQIMQWRADLTGLPIDFICVEALARYWEERAKITARFGYAIAVKEVFQGEGMREPMYWLTFHYRQRMLGKAARPSLEQALEQPRQYDDMTVGMVRSFEDWPLVKAAWTELLNATPGRTMFQLPEYLQGWWMHLGWQHELCIIVTLRGGRVVALAPMYVAHIQILGRQLRTLTFLGQPSEADRPTLLAHPDDVATAEATARYIVDAGKLWDRIVLYEQNPNTPFFRAMQQQLTASRALMSQLDAPACTYVSISGKWDAYLSSRSKSFRKNIRRRMNQLEKLGDLRFELIRSRGEIETALQTYFDVELKSWKRGSLIGATHSAAHQSFYRALAQGLPAGAEMQCKILRLNGQPIAATFGILWQRCFYSLHIAHDEAFDEHSPGVVLTAIELEEAFKHADYDTLDFLGGFLTNKLSWATGSIETVALYVSRPGLRTWLHHLINFTLRPLLRRFLVHTNLLAPAQQLKAYLKTRLGRDD